VHTVVLLQPVGKRQRQALIVADACSTPTGRQFITDRVSILRSLFDTASEISVFHRKLVPWRKERISYDLFAANGTSIQTYEGYTLTFNHGLRRDFTWRFVVADIQIAIIELDLLCNFGLW
jgi:hypothetical protein